MAFSKIFIATALTLDVSAILLNGLIAYILKKHKKTTIITFWLIYCLSISDVLVGITSLICHSLLLKLNSGLSSLSSSTQFLIDLQECGFELSGNLIVIIAIDRCIRMKYLNRYSRIMTRLRARLTMLFTVIFSILLMILLFAVSEDLAPTVLFGYSVFHAITTLSVYAIYIRTYFLIKNQPSALQIAKQSDVALRHIPDKRLEVQNKRSSAQHVSGSSKSKLGMVNDSVDEAERSQPCVLTNRATGFESQNEAFILPDCPTNSPMKVIDKKEKHDSIRINANVSHFVENYTTSPAIDATKKGDKLLALFFILLALFICYFPNIINTFYTFATIHESYVASCISEICVLLNSSLNAIILIAFNKQMQRNIKAIFAKG